MPLKKLSIIIPVFNEEHTVAAVIDKVLNVKLPKGIEKELIIVNDASFDKSIHVLENYKNHTTSQLKIINHQHNQGKGGAVHTALLSVTGDYVIIQDADLELDPEDYNVLLEPVLNNKAHVVYGSRFLNAKKNLNQKPLSFLANRFLTRLSNLSFKTHLTDMETCYKLMPADVVKTFGLKEKRFGFEPEITARLARNRFLTITEVPIKYFARTGHQGKKIGWKDGIHAIWCIVKYGWLKR
jgi:glycosyltransferase involved in cell wall biosynthesis